MHEGRFKGSEGRRSGPRTDSLTSHFLNLASLKLKFLSYQSSMIEDDKVNRRFFLFETESATTSWFCLTCKLLLRLIGHQGRWTVQTLLLQSTVGLIRTHTYSHLLTLTSGRRYTREIHHSTFTTSLKHLQGSKRWQRSFLLLSVRRGIPYCFSVSLFYLHSSSMTSLLLAC